MEKVKPSQRLWRTLLRVVGSDINVFYPNKSWIYVEIPAWDRSKTVTICLADIPKNKRDLLRIGYRFHAHVNIGAEKIDDLKFDSLEME